MMVSFVNELNNRITITSRTSEIYVSTQIIGPSSVYDFTVTKDEANKIMKLWQDMGVKPE